MLIWTPPFALTTPDDVMPVHVRVPVSVIPEHVRFVQDRVPESVTPEHVRFVQDNVPVSVIPLTVIAPSTDKLDVNVDVVFFIRICHPYT